MSRPARVLICCGSGGVGKTTTSAALAIRLARAGERVVVLTIDPARRLADALGIADLGNSAVPVPLDAHAKGTLHAMMLDSKRTFDDIIERFAPSIEARDRILRNHIYRHVSARLAGAHEYMAMEKLFELQADGRWDTVVVDTPPTRHALDFLRAPERLANLMDEGVMRWLVLPASRGGWRMLERGSEVLASVLQRFLGDGTIGDIAEFFASLQSLWEGFRERSMQVRALLRARETRFFLITTPAPSARAEALEFLGILEESGMPFGGFLVNRCATPATSGERPTFGAVADDPLYDATVAALRALPDRRARLVAAQEAALADLKAHARAGVPIWRIPDVTWELHDIAALTRFSDALPDLRRS